MLYKPGVIDEKETDFLFDVGIFNNDIDIKEVAAIQGFYEKYGYIPESHIVTFLNWLIFTARKNISDNLEDITKSTFTGRCGVAQIFFEQLLDKMNLNRMTFNVGDVLDTESIHALTCVEIPTKHNGEDVNVAFMLDPTFRQFCITEENRFERYEEEPRWSVRMSTPHPGYFLNLTEKGRNFAQELIYYGYFKINEDNLKTYFDSFALYVTPKEEYEDISQVGMISSTTISGIDYWNGMLAARKKLFITSYKFDLSTPREIIQKEANKLLNRILRKNIQSELDKLFEEQNIEVTSTNSFSR